MRRGTFMFLLGGLLTWMLFSLRRREKRTMDRLLELFMYNVKNSFRRSMIFGRIVPGLLLRKIIRRFS